MNLRASLVATLAHAGEVLVSLFVALAIVKGLEVVGVALPEGALTVIGTLVINGLLKFLRTIEGGPVTDYVNER